MKVLLNHLNYLEKDKVMGEWSGQKVGGLYRGEIGGGGKER